MMQAFRNAAKPVLWVLTITFFIWLVWDLSGLGSGTGGIFTNTTVGKINGKRVDLRAFDQRVQNLVSAEQQRGASLGQDGVQQIRDRVWDQVVQEYLLAAEYKRLGLSVSDDDVAEAIKNVPPPEARSIPTFQTNGQFDIDKYQRWLRSAEGQAFVPGLEFQYRDQLLQAKLFRTVVADVFLSDATLWERYRDEKEQVKVGMVRIDPAVAVNDQAAAVTDDEARTYYNAHKDEFKRKPTAYLSYLSVSRLPIASDTAAALARATALRSEIQQGAPFEEVAQRESSDTVSGRQGGDLGEAKASSYVPEFSKAAMALPLNTLSEPVLSPFGYHLIKVESRKADTFKARHILVPIEVTGTHRDLLDQVADSLETLGAEKLDRAALDTTARALKLTVQSAPPVTEGNRVTLADGRAVPDAGVWAFQAKVGEHSSVIEAPDAYFLFRLDSLHKEGVPSFETSKGQVLSKLRLDKKRVQARKLADQLVAQARAGTPLAQAAKAMGFEYREMGPFARLSAPLGSPVLIGAAFGTPKGKVSSPVDAASVAAGPDLGDPAVYLFEGLERILADSAEFTKTLAAIREQTVSAARRARVNSYMASLKEGAKLVDRRSEVYRTAAQNAALAAQQGIQQ